MLQPEVWSATSFLFEQQISANYFLLLSGKRDNHTSELKARTCFPHSVFSITVQILLHLLCYPSLNAHTCLHCLFAPSGNPWYTPITLSPRKVKKEKMRSTKVLYGFILINHSLITWFHCCNISIISLHESFRMFSLISTIALYPPVKKGKQVCRPPSGNRLHPAGITHLPTTHRYRRAGRASLERLGSHSIYPNWKGF